MHYVVVVDEQQAVVGVVAVLVMAEGEGVLGVQPLDLGWVAAGGGPDVDTASFR
jgi:hypothetical protein